MLSQSGLCKNGTAIEKGTNTSSPFETWLCANCNRAPCDISKATQSSNQQSLSSSTSIAKSRTIARALSLEKPLDASKETIFGFVGDTMRKQDILTVQKDEKLDAIVPKLKLVSGLAVVDEANKVIGVISRKVSCFERLLGPCPSVAIVGVTHCSNI